MIKELVKELRKDKEPGSYYHSWQCNIAVAFQDEFNRSYVKNGVHEISNQAAKNFLDLLIYVDEKKEEVE